MGCCRLIVFALLFLAISFVAVGVSFCAPFWMKDIRIGTGLIKVDAYSNYGLWGFQQCGFNIDDIVNTFKGEECSYKWAWQNDWKWEKGLPVWHLACQGLFGFGIVTLLITFIFAYTNLCCQCCNSAGLRITGTFIIIAVIEIGLALGLFGGFAHKEWGIDDIGKFDWGYWVGVGGVCGAFVSGLLFLIMCCRTQAYDGYQRGDVV